jgi:squalene-hopene/tetraprenyl-beta-curcumene cyclase
MDRLTEASTSPHWSPKLAASYLDKRAEAWAGWSPAKKTGGPCISCHTSGPYLLVRPALRRALGETQPTRWETGLLNAMQARLAVSNSKERSSPEVAVESVYAALLLVPDDTVHPRALERMWALQISDGPSRGAWPWFNFHLEPFETQPAEFYGAALAALASSSSPPEYARQPSVQQHLADLSAYLERQSASESLHNRLALLWASARLPAVLPEPARHSLIEEVWHKQGPDGGWSVQSLGPWRTGSILPAVPVSDSYATALVAFALQRGGVKRSDERLARALDWLAAHQDKQGGFWPGQSMNKTYPSGSMQESFMRDVASAFASLALLADSHPLDLP